MLLLAVLGLDIRINGTIIIRFQHLNGPPLLHWQTEGEEVLVVVDRLLPRNRLYHRCVASATPMLALPRRQIALPWNIGPFVISMKALRIP